MANLEQRRACFALERVRGVERRDDREKYKTQLVKLPARLHTNGLGQTVAFYLAAGKDAPESRICGWLEDWLRQAGVYPAGPPLIDAIVGKGVADAQAEVRYGEASDEARALAVWLKRFAEAFIETPARD